MKIEVINNKNTKVEDLTLDNSVFGLDENKILLAQCVHVYRTNQRQGTSHTLTRSEVSGGGRKPWRQKGTGRARHGSIRSPIWVKGGIAHGPKPKNYVKKLPKKMKKMGMKVALSSKFRDGQIKVIDAIKLTKPSTKEVASLLEKIKMNRKTLIIMNKSDQTIVRSVANIEDVDVVTYDSLNIYELLNKKEILFEKDAIVSLEKRYK